MLKKWMNANIQSFTSYQKSMYGTKIINKCNKFRMEYRNWWIFWVMLIFQNCAMSQIIFLNWIGILWNKVLLFLFCTIQELLNVEITNMCGKIDTQTYHEFTIDIVISRETQYVPKKLNDNDMLYFIWKTI